MSDSPYRVPAPRPPETPDPYLVAWRDLRRRRIAMWASLFLWLPISVIAICLLLSQGIFVLLPLMAIIGAAQLRAAQFRCPKCGHRFHERPWSRDALFSGVHRPWQRLCLHCGIAVGTPKNGSATDVA